MRPRTATIQVSKNEEDLWVVEIGDPKSSSATIRGIGKHLNELLTDAVINWKIKEGLSYLMFNWISGFIFGVCITVLFLFAYSFNGFVHKTIEGIMQWQ